MLEFWSPVVRAVITKACEDNAFRPKQPRKCFSVESVTPDSVLRVWKGTAYMGSLVPYTSSKVPASDGRDLITMKIVLFATP